MKLRICFAALSSFMVASLAIAQGPPGGGGPGGFFRMMGPENSQLAIVSMAEVQTELALTAEQKNQLDELLAANQTAVQEAMAAVDFQAMMALEPEERDAQMAEIRKKTDAVGRESEEKLPAIFNDSQKSRLAQLRLQREGLASLGRPDMAKKLQLSDDQLERLKPILPMLGPGPQPNMRGPGFGPPPGGGPPDPIQMEEDRKRGTEQALAILTDEQRSNWKELQGKEFKFPEPQMRMGGMGGPEVALVEKFDADENGWLNKDERVAARVEAKKTAGGGFGRRGGPGGPGGFGPPGGPPGGGPPGGPGGGPPGMGGGPRPASKPGVHVSIEDAAVFPEAKLYDANVLRTLFFEFENEDWESELADFKNTDVEVNAELTVDGRTYSNVGVSFRGASSFMMTPAGYKRSFNISLDLVEKKQRLYGHQTLNLLNSNGDSSMMHTVLFSHIARQYLPAPQANFVRVVVNGEDWGIYPNAQQFNREFLDETYGNSKGPRWKVSGSPGGGGSLAYLGDDVTRYKRLYEIKSNDTEKSWSKLINLCKVLNETPVDELEAALEPIFDIDGALRFLAVDCVLINNDGYWVRASDYNLYCDTNDRFHVIPHDMNEAFGPAMGPGVGRGGRGGRGGRPGDNPGGGDAGRPQGEPKADTPPPTPTSPVGLDPLVALTDSSKPLRSKLLAVPALKKRYLQYVHEIADKSLNWHNLGPVVEDYRKLIEEEVAIDTRKLSSNEAFTASVSDGSAESRIEPDAQPPRRRELSLKDFANQRREYLLNHAAVKEALEK